MIEDWIPIVMFIGITIVFCVFFWYRHRMRGEMQKTIRNAMDKGQELTPELIAAIGQPARPKDRDMRLAILSIAIAVALAIFGAAIPEDSNEAQQAMLAIAAFPFCIGVAFFILSRLSRRES